MTRQRAWQKRMLRSGRCYKCGQPRAEGDNRVCAVHRAKLQHLAKLNYRNRHGLPPELPPGSPPHFTLRTRFPLDAVALLGTMPDKDLALKFQISVSSVWRHRVEMRIPSHNQKS